jgi:O-antigen/teichoic acid export membrane protein
MTVEGTQPDLLDSAEAGPRAIRGGTIRTVGYGVGLVLTLVSAPLLTRHLGVVDFGRLVTVASLIAIVTILADAGLTMVGVREYAVRDAVGRRQLMRNLVAVRLLVAVLGGLCAVLFAYVVGYDSILVAGTALGGVALVFTMAQHTYVIPLTSELRLGVATALELLRQVLTVAGVVALVIAGSGLLGFFILPIPVAVVVLVITLFAIRHHRGARPGLDVDEWRYLLVETIPAAAASVLASVFYRVAIVMMSLIATAIQTGYFSASYRVVEALIAIPSLVVGTAYPVLSRAADTDQNRLAYGFQRVFEVCIILGAWIALGVVAGAEPIIAFIGGDEFAPAVPVLQIQGPALAASFLVALFGGTLWVVRAKRQLVIGNLVGVVAAVILTAVLVPVAEAKGAAGAMVAAEALLAIWLGMALLKPRPELRPSLAVVPKSLIALAAGAAVALSPLPELAVVVIGSAVYFAVLLLSRAIPVEIWDAIVHRRAQDVLEPPAR